MTPLPMTGALPWPWPEPLPWWSGDYADIRERLRRDRRFEIEEVWLPDSDDSWVAFCNRHGTHDFHFDWRQLNERDRQLVQRGRQLTDRVAQEVATWEAEQRRRQAEKQEQSDREWREMTTARAYWSGINPHYREQPYHAVKITKTGVVYGATLKAGKSYWLPHNVALAIREASR